MPYDINRLLDVNNKQIRIEFVNRRTNKTMFTAWRPGAVLPMVKETLDEINREYGLGYAWIEVRQ